MWISRSTQGGFSFPAYFACQTLRYSIGLTDRLYYHDSYLFDFTAEVLSRSFDGLRLELDRTAFYPTSGGQPFDTGTLSGIPVVDVIEEGDALIHVLAHPWPDDLTRVEGHINSVRRLDHMRQHSGQHLLSAVMAENFSLATVSFHLGPDYATVDVEPATASAEMLLAIEERVNARLLENLALSVSFEDASLAQGLRKAPDRTGLLRIVTMDGLDRSACGGTHVRHTGEIGCVVLGKTEKVRKAQRIEFYCGERARRALRERLNAAEQSAATLRDRLAESDKLRRKLSLELAVIAGQRRFAESVPDQSSSFVWMEEVEEIGEEIRASVDAFLSNPGTLAVILGTKGTSILLGAHASLNLDCGKLLKAQLDAKGGRGGGSSKLAQGTLPSLEVLRSLADDLVR